MKALVIIPDMQIMGGNVDFSDSETVRLKEIYKFLDTKKITVVPFGSGMLYTGIERPLDIKLGQEKWGFSIDENHQVIGRGVLFGLGEKGEDMSCFLLAEDIVERFNLDLYVHITREQYEDIKDQGLLDD